MELTTALVEYKFFSKQKVYQIYSNLIWMKEHCNERDWINDWQAILHFYSAKQNELQERYYAAEAKRQETLRLMDAQGQLS